ncbi:hypothetical protein NQ317_003383 [Molorchus minor]|uniref:Uncharacterized protein n=1 Tax=Molorchus minor TaxID=1323400 RepID=A0ABQ9K670_9CUCU|nr:hypothetical protein NQ317_003383 [Molorchus minor]
MTFVLLKTMIPRVINNIPKLVEIGEVITETGEGGAMKRLKCSTFCDCKCAAYRLRDKGEFLTFRCGEIR